MGTRTYCDSCGCTCPSPVVYEIRKAGGVLDPQHQHAAQQLQAVQQQIIKAAPGSPIGGAGGPANFNPPMQPHKFIIRVDLCPTCEGTWVERVKKLTQASGE